MPTARKFGAVPIKNIVVHERYRVNKGDIEELALSINSLGLLNPITVSQLPDGRFKLVAGERRLLAHKWLKKEEIEVQLFNELDPHEAELAEIEENSRRLDFHWTEQAMSILQYHEHRKRTMGSEWGIEQTADCLSMGKTYVSNALTVARALQKSPDKFKAFDSIAAAYNSLSRETTRIVDAEMTEFMQAEDPEEFLKDVDDDDVEGDPLLAEMMKAKPSPKPAYVSPVNDVFEKSFQDFIAQDFSGLKRLFNVVHCDFPYGINFHKSDQANIERRGDESYDDSPEIYWGLIGFLCSHAPRILAPKAHVLFWYPTAEYTKTVEAFSSAGFSVNPVPLIWLKSDNTGILPDPQRGPRRIYESALLMSWGDRLISRAVSNAIAFPANRAKAQHPSEKPTEVLQHFLTMLVDSHTHMLDPTCGGGTSLVAAEALGAASVTGVEMNPLHVSTSRNALTKLRLSK